ncbi:MAG: hypothetical protein V1899_00565 [Planctomycetota bacterium]
MKQKLIEAAAEILDWAVAQKIPAYLIGGMAVQRWGEPRLTRDVDVSLFIGFGNEQIVIRELLKHFRPRRDGMEEFALQNRVVLLHATNGAPLNVALGAFVFEEESAKRASPYMYTSESALLTCSAEDLVIMKVFAGRPIDVIDVERILIRQGKALNLRHIRHWLAMLADLKDDPDLAKPFEDALKKVEMLRGGRQ